MTRLLIFLDTEPASWLRVGAAGVAARGDAANLVRDASDSAVIAVVPGEAVVVHWVAMPVLAPAQANAAARLMAAEVIAGPIDTAHIALGTATADGQRPIAVVDQALMRSWVDQLAQLGIAADAIVPLPMLLPLGEGVTIYDQGPRCNARGDHLAFTAETDVAELLLGGSTPQRIDRAAFEAGLAATVAAAPINLRQGPFAPRRDWQVAPARLKRLAVLAAASAGLFVATAAIGFIQTSIAANRAETQLAAAARTVLPRGTTITDPRGQVAARLASLGGGSRSFSALATQLMAALRDRPSVALRSLQYSRDGGLTAVIETAGPDEGQAVAQALMRRGGSATSLVAQAANPRSEGGKTVVDLIVRWQ